jgi:chromosome segregation ATPase
LENLNKFLKNNKNKNVSMPGEIYVKNLGEITPCAFFNNYHILNNNQQSHIYVNNKEEEQAIKNIIQDELEQTRNLYQSVTKKTIAQKNVYSKNISKFEELKKEIETLKNPHTDKSNYNCELNSKNNLTTAPGTQKEKESKDNLGHLKTQCAENIQKNEEILKELEEELLNLKNTKDDVLNKIDSQKKINEKIDKEVSSLNNELSDKFSLIYQLETKLEKLKKKKKKQVEG